jgi:hypothetical protein
MKTVLKAALIGLMACAFLLLVLGLAFWTGNAFQLIWLHVLVGVILVGLLWTLSAIAAATGVATGTVAMAVGWGVLVLALGVLQRELIPGPWHWTVQVLHLVVSMGAVWWGRRLAKDIGRLAAARLHGRALA